MGVICNIGQKSTSKKGMLDSFDWVWCYARGIANILSFADVQRIYKFTYNEIEPDTFDVYKLDRIILFRQNLEGLYYCNG
eukprot:11693837-Ditylum_brightwellii.AAC.1